MIFRLKSIKNTLQQQVAIAPLIVFRIAFGLLLSFSVVRFYYYGWITEMYVKPTYYFTYLGFDWVKPFGELGMYAIFLLLAISALCIALGAFYRLNTLLFFFSFTYVELIDKTNYLNHYYFVTVVAFLLIFMPAHRAFSIDAYLFPSVKRSRIPLFYIFLIKFQICVLYFFAGLAKLNYEWLANAQPLALWLRAKAGLPILGGLFDYKQTAYLFSWFGAAFDLFIWIFLLKNKTRKVAYFSVIVFHLATWVLFPIGMFPFFMIGLNLVFFSFNKFQLLIEKKSFNSVNNSPQIGRGSFLFLAIFVLVQVIIPLRHLAYSSNVYWSEEGYRFSWRVMLMEKAGYITFIIKDENNLNYQQEVNNSNYLTPNQIKMMATQPDMILQFAHFLKDEYKAYGIKNPKIYAQSFATLNGKGSKPFIKANVDLATISRDLKNRNSWVLPYPY